MMDNKQEAALQLELTSQLKPSFGEQFVIFRLSKLIKDEDDGLKNNNTEQLDIVQKLAYEST
jgi:hypothetical protein